MTTNAREFSNLNSSPNPEHWVKMMLELPDMAPSICQMREMMLAPILADGCQRVLDGGCGPGVSTVEMARRLPAAKEIIGMDMSQNMLDYARNLNAPDCVSFCEGSLCDIPFADNHFDAVRVERVLHHIENTTDAIRELIRVTKPGGLIIACEPDVRRIYVHPVPPVDTATFSRRFSDNLAAGEVAAYLPAIFKDAGLSIEQSTTLSMTFNDLSSLENGFDTVEELRTILREEHHEDDIDALDQAIARGDAYLDVPMTLLVARKPS